MSSATRTRRRRDRQHQEPHRPVSAAAPGGAAPASPAVPGPAVPVTPRLRAKPGSIGGIRVHQLVLVELAAALVLVGRLIHPAALVGCSAAAGALAVLALARRRRRPLLEWIATVRAMRRRTSAAQPAQPGTDAALVPLVESEPGLRTCEHIDRRDPGQRAVGFLGDGTFLTAVVRVETRDEPLRPPPGSRTLPLGLLSSALEVDDIRLESIQLVQYTQPAPAPHLPEQAVAARSYAPLQARTGTAAVQLTWLALKLDPELCPEAVEARGGGLDGTKRALLRAADQLTRELTGHGFRAAVLEEREVISALGTALCVNPLAHHTAEGRPTRRTSETARAWRCDDRWHTSYWIGGWPQVGPDGASLAGVAGVWSKAPAMASTFALTLSRGGSGAPILSGYVRLTARSENELVAARREAERLGASVQARLVRLDREQLPGLLATLPLGGTR